jgi:hypothetical protein
MKRIIYHLILLLMISSCGNSNQSQGYDSTNSTTESSNVDESNSANYDENIDASNDGEKINCPNCNGNKVVDCPYCNGSGRKHCSNCDGDGWSGDVRCLDCYGEGILSCEESVNCGTCDGFGYGYAKVCGLCDGTTIRNSGDNMGQTCICAAPFRDVYSGLLSALIPNSGNEILDQTMRGASISDKPGYLFYPPND